jgi:hypothetical protein
VIVFLHGAALFAAQRRELGFDGGAERQQRRSERCAGEQQRVEPGWPRRLDSSKVTLIMITFLHGNAR